MTRPLKDMLLNFSIVPSVPETGVTCLFCYLFKRLFVLLISTPISWPIIFQGLNWFILVTERFHPTISSCQVSSTVNMSDSRLPPFVGSSCHVMSTSIVGPVSGTPVCVGLTTWFLDPLAVTPTSRHTLLLPPPQCPYRPHPQ